VRTLGGMTNDQKHALGVFMLIVGIVWFFFWIIWMPPLTFAVLWIVAKIGFEPNVLVKILFYSEALLALCAIGLGLYINLRRLMPEKKNRTDPLRK
jgi:hypothetical protein